MTEKATVRIGETEVVKSKIVSLVATPAKAGHDNGDSRGYGYAPTPARLVVQTEKREYVECGPRPKDRRYGIKAPLAQPDVDESVAKSDAAVQERLAEVLAALDRSGSGESL